MFKSRKFKISLIAMFAGFTILGFQNCSPTKFQGISNVSDLSFSAGIPDSDIAAEDTTILASQPEEQIEPPMSDTVFSIVTALPQAPEVQTPMDMPQENAPETPEVVDTKAPEKAPEAPEAPEVVVDTKAPEKAPEAIETPEVADGDSAEAPPIASAPIEENQSVEEEESLVECDLGRPNSKVILSGILKKGSNASSTRVCMSEHACLQIVNAFAAKRDCSLLQTAGASNSQNDQCTQIFPGSRGTCKNAAKVSDDEIASILKNME